MARTTLPQEVDVLRFFETGPLERVLPVFNIVDHKMRERMRERGATDQAERSTGASKQRKRKTEEISSEPTVKSDSPL